MINIHLKDTTSIVWELNVSQDSANPKSVQVNDRKMN